MTKSPLEKPKSKGVGKRGFDCRSGRSSMRIQKLIDNETKSIREQLKKQEEQNLSNNNQSWEQLNKQEEQNRSNNNQIWEQLKKQEQNLRNNNPILEQLKKLEEQNLSILELLRVARNPPVAVPGELVENELQQEETTAQINVEDIRTFAWFSCTDPFIED